MRYYDYFKNIEDQILLDIYTDFSMEHVINNIGRLIEKQLKKINQHSNSYIHPTAEISRNATIKGDVYIGPQVKIQDFASIIGPAIILDDTLIGKSSFIRGGVIIGSKSIIGNASEIVSSIIHNKTSITHFNVITHSIIGSNVNFSSYSCTAAFLLKNKSIFQLDEEIYLTDMNLTKIKVIDNKFGAIVGDNCRIGAYSILNPGTTLSVGCIVYPHISLKAGFYEENLIIHIPGYNSSVKTKENPAILKEII